ncbi:MAG: TetR/AcrR family transcriptional regulator [Luteibacter sp.]|uniref:TetR/AcrR family transcriptional regulator n=1 Tax=Luteibacter sp. TaxID=1886636 RepID=UPI0028072735|nr:TetR/AcrR family transcriptional regulator [Luteibacter sp.]MDQ7996142.1 TetR/AcrR family transcriptional regulator [Luteibacter sp.]MDQ8048837.1 TetR/AcrR family transcriptional regulator [Luteibacter sp.]
MSHLESRPASDHQQRVLQAACALFLRDGYRVSMVAVAREAGVSKQTVYAHFENKDTLFHAAVQQLAHPLHASLAPESRGLADTLYALADAHHTYVMDHEHVALGRMLIAEAPRFPAAAKTFFRTAIGTVAVRLSRCMAEAMDAGEMRRDDPEVAAELFLAMLHGLEGDRRLFGMRARGQKAQDEWARHAVTVFMHAYDIPTDGRPRKIKKPGIGTEFS